MSYTPKNRFNLPMSLIGAEDPRYSPLNKSSKQIKKTGTGDRGFVKELDPDLLSEHVSLSLDDWWGHSPKFVGTEFFVCLVEDEPLTSGELRSYRITRGELSDTFTLIDTVVFADKGPSEISYANGRVFIILGDSCVQDIVINTETGIFGAVIETTEVVTSMYNVSAHPTKVGYFGVQVYIEAGPAYYIYFYQDGVLDHSVKLGSRFRSWRFFPDFNEDDTPMYNITMPDDIDIYNDSFELIGQGINRNVNHAQSATISSGSVKNRYLVLFYPDTPYDAIVVYRINIHYSQYSQVFRAFKVSHPTIEGTSYRPSNGIITPESNKLYSTTSYNPFGDDLPIIARHLLNHGTLELTLDKFHSFVEGLSSENLSTFDIDFTNNRLIVFKNWYAGDPSRAFSKLFSFKIN